ncbi:UDP-glucosyltransferase 2-like [Toxorhynchites rutilus septentrionalis]|uniref:UDP-glucosyltransferase 2-like n=1 Tax=Toxorhynchites rutilus septentrionalis TaxID=329112 RepID=UPI002478C277|nr:UDP-glucosyltransferase 2-like [Toxorhynchites rutilus septentrionalis]
MKVVLALMLVFSGVIQAANILYIDGVPSPSHFIWHRALIYGLAGKGHNVTAVSVDTEENAPSNVTFIKVEGVYEKFFDSHDDALDFFAMIELNTFSMMNIFNDYILRSCMYSLESEGLKQILNYPAGFKFDLIISDYLQGPCISALTQHKFGRPPYIPATGFHGFTTATPMSGTYSFSGMVPNHEYDVTEHMNFRQRFMNFLYNHWEELSKSYIMIPAIDKLVRKIMPDIPYVGELDKDARVILLNSNPVIQYSEPSMPNVISVGGMQIIKTKKLPEDLSTILDKAKPGAILFSLGTNVRSDLLGKERIIEIMNAMRQLPQYQFLWKFESDGLPIEVPKNVYIRKWMPQNDLLAHPNLKLFITHSGLLSTQEAIWHGVPIIGFPVFADQNRNINYCTQMGVGKRLSIKDVKSKDLVDAVQEIMTEKRYQKNMADLSGMFRDQKEHPLDRAIWWVEWVLRHPNSTILQSNGVNINWIVKYSFDVIVPLVLLGVLVFSMILKSVKCVLVMKTSSKVKHE